MRKGAVMSNDNPFITPYDRPNTGKWRFFVVILGIIILVIGLSLFGGWVFNNLSAVGDTSNAFLLALHSGNYEDAYARILPDGRLNSPADLARALRQTWPPVIDWRLQEFNIDGDFAIVAGVLWLEGNGANGIEISLYRIEGQWVILNARLYNPEGIQPLW